MDKYQATFLSWEKVASLYEQIFMNLELYNDTYDYFCELVSSKNAGIFEIACGPGNITRYIQNKRHDFEIFGIDISVNMIELARKNVPDAKFEVMDCRDIDQIDKTFDAVICGFCLPYLAETDLDKLLRDTASILNERGIIYISCIEGDYRSSGFELASTGKDGMFVYYYSEEDLKKKLFENKFGILKVFKKHYQKKDGSDSVHLIMIAEKTSD